jgi:hypothetical protein
MIRKVMAKMFTEKRQLMRVATKIVHEKWPMIT